ncbi:MAG: hypothetical protein AB8G99_04485 [Planctomycetaceae bacterium]
MTLPNQEGEAARKRQRKLPLSEYFKPLNHFRWIWKSTTAWAVTRRYQLLASCVPFILICVSLLVWSLTPAPNTRITYELARAAAVRQDDKEQARLYLSRLIQSNPDKPAYQFALALQHVEEENIAAAVGVLDRITSNGISQQEGYAPADFLMASLAANSAGGLKLPVPRIIALLSNVLRTEPSHAEANRLMSIVHLGNNQPALAEPYLARIAKTNPALLLELSELQAKLGKREAAKESAQKAERKARESIEGGENQPEKIIVWARALRVLGKRSEAERVLSENSRRDLDEFRQPLIDLYVSWARERLRKSPFYKRQAIDLLAKAFLLKPDNVEVASMLTTLAGDQSELPPKLSARLNQHWQQQAASPDANAATLRVGSELARIRGDEQQAIRLLQKAASKSSNYEDALVEAYHSANRRDEAEQLLQKRKATYEGKLEQNPTDAVTRIRLARLLASVGVLSEAEEVIRAAPQTGRRMRAELGSVLRQRLSASKLDPSTRQNVLQEALELTPSDAKLLTQAAALAASDRETGPAMRRFILSLSAKGSLPTGLAYAALGTANLDAKKYGQAEKDLQESLRSEPGNPLAWNNLAMVLMQKTKPNPKLARDAAKAALRLLPEHETLMATYGESLLMCEEWQAATRVLQKAIQLGKNTSDIHNQLATAYDQLGNSEMAEEHRSLAAEAPR